MLGNAGRFDEATDVIAKFEAQGLTHPLVDDGARTRSTTSSAPGSSPSACRPARPKCSTASASRWPATAAPTSRWSSCGSGSISIPAPTSSRWSWASSTTAPASTRPPTPSTTPSPPNSPMKPTAVVRVAENLDAHGRPRRSDPPAGQHRHHQPERPRRDLGARRPAAHRRAVRRGRRYLYQGAGARPAATAPATGASTTCAASPTSATRSGPRPRPISCKALELNPDQPQVLNYLGYSWVDQGMNLDAGPRDDREGRRRRRPTTATSSTAWAGPFTASAASTRPWRTLEQAVQLRPNDPEINDHLGDAYWRVRPQARGEVPVDHRVCGR